MSARVAGKLLPLAVMLLGMAAAAWGANDYAWDLPRGFPVPAVPADNPMSAAKVALGARLFSDPRLSASGRHSCESCHSPGRAFTDGLPLSRGATGEIVPLNAPTLLNVAYQPSLGWKDEGVRTLEQQMRGPMFNEHPPELGLAGREREVEAALAADPGMSRAFAEAFPAQPISMDNVIRAIAAYQRTLFAGDSPFDRYVFAGEHDALGEEEERGMRLFFSERSGCSSCHGGINFSGPWVDSTRPVADAVFADTGTGTKVRVPTLRNLGRTGPYLHDGRFATVEAVLDHYERLAADGAAEPRLRRAPLTTAERASLARFLASLDQR